MKMATGKYLITGTLLVLLSTFSNKAFSQDENDALRYSFLMPGGTARSMGFGSALGSVGGDFTSLSVNPAGIGIYRRSEIMFTPSLKLNNVEGNYLRESDDDHYTRFNFNNAGVIFSRAERGKRYEKSNWKAVSFGFGFNRLADFNRSYSYGGLMQGPLTSNTHSSFSEVFVADANANPANATTTGTLANLGYESFLINPDSSFSSFSTLANWETGLNQLRAVQERGGVNEILFSLGGNYKEKIMIGATLGLPSLRYTSERFFEEADASGDPDNDFESFRYRESLSTTGRGVNLKLGVIVKPSDAFRFGVAIHTPTWWYRMSEVYNSSLTTNTENFKSVINPSDINPITVVDAPENRFEYSLTTPWRGILSGTVMMGQYGFITADYEYVDYKSMRYNFDNEFTLAESARNKVIRNTFQGASNFRIGIEGRMDNIFLRGGFGYYGNPYKSGDYDFSRMNISAGLGYRTGSFFTDLAFVHTFFKEFETPYTLPAPVVTPSARLNNRLNNLALTIGWKM